MDTSWVFLLLSKHLQGPIIRSLEADTGRQIRVEGKFDTRILSRHPRIVAERVTVGNPPWTAPGVTAEIGHLVLTYDWPGFGHWWRLRRIEAQQVTLNLSRDPAGHANWQMRPPEADDGSGPPLIHSLSMPDARVHFDDQIRRLQFDGVVSAQDVMAGARNEGLRIEGAGRLNGRDANFALGCDPLATVARDQPYGCKFNETSSGSKLTGRVTVPQPFDFRTLEAAFAAEGADMKDLFFLTGVTLPDTAAYHLSGRFARHGRHLEFQDLQATSGRSDVQGKLLIELNRGGPSHVEAQLRSRLLRVSDLGQRAAGRLPEPPPGEPQRVIPDTTLQFPGARKSDAVIHFQAQTVEAGRVSIKSVAATVKIGEGVITGAPISGSLKDAKINGEFKIDGSHNVTASELDVRLTNLKLGLGDAAPPIDGPLQVRMTLKGHGSSIREAASNADGTLTAVLPHGIVRSSLAEAAGFDLRALGLMAGGNSDDTGIRCGVASLEVRNGTLTSQRLLLDTEPVLITGEGTISLDSESLDLRFHGQPKHPRLRVRSALLVRGTFGHPSFSIEAAKPAMQAGGAIALGVLLTPVAAMLAFVDPGLAKDADCAALLGQARGEAK